MIKWSEKDLINKWVREYPLDTQASLPWDVLSVLVKNLSSDSKLPVPVLLEAIRLRDVAGFFLVCSNLDVTEYTSPDLLLQDRLVSELFSKFNFLNSPFNRRQKAELKFAEAEVMCRETNARLRHLHTADNVIQAVLHSTSREISGILGSFDLNEMLESSRFGPGSTLCVKGPYTTEYFKLCEKSPSVSSSAFPYAEALIEHDLMWKAYLMGVPPHLVTGPFSPIDGLGVELSISDYNKAAFVPKNAKTDRSIAIEPYFNVFFQLGVGSMIRKRLRARGINLDSQVRNQELACEGSINGHLATIDFSMASDTISRATVCELVPEEWVNHLHRLRSSHYIMDQRKPVQYEKFSSMGNGFTFELETLLFFSVAVACCKYLDVDTKDISVYGDDVILPVQACDLFSKVTSYLGFRINDDKSFASGLFRESCGKDYLKGHLVRPVFCKELRTVQHVVSLSNRLSELNNSVGDDSRLSAMLSNAVSFCHSLIPSDVRKLVIGPPSEDVDGYIHQRDISAFAGSPLVKWNRKLFAWEHPIIHFRPKKINRRDGAVSLWLNNSLKTVSQEQMCSRLLLSSIRGHVPFRTSDFQKEVIPREITGRKIGDYFFAQRLVWSLVD